MSVSVVEGFIFFTKSLTKFFGISKEQSYGCAKKWVGAPGWL